MSLLTEDTPYDSLQSYYFYQQQLQSPPVIPVSWTSLQPSAQPSSPPAYSSPPYTPVTGCYSSLIPDASSSPISPAASYSTSGYYSSSYNSSTPSCSPDNSSSSPSYPSSASVFNCSPGYFSSTLHSSSSLGHSSIQHSSPLAEPLNLSLPASHAPGSAKQQRHDEIRRKPALSYVAMIAQALLSSPNGRMALSDIYDHIMENVPFYRSTTLAWRNAVRHNLSVNEAFIRAGRTDIGRGHYWTIHPACVMQFYQGDYNRRKAAAKVQQSQRESAAASKKH